MKSSRFLFTCRPLDGHYLPLVPLATAVQEAGHAVAFATGAPVVETARAAGFEAFPAGPDQDFRATWAPRFPGFDRLVGDAQRRFFFTTIFGDLELAPRARALQEVLGNWRPDLVLHDVAELAAPLVCTAVGIPYVDVSYGSLVPLAVLEAAGQAAAPHWRDRGLEPDRYAGLFRHLYLDTSPPGLQNDEINRIGPVRQLRPAAAGAGAHPPRAPVPSVRPTVYVTMGTVWNRDLDLFRRILEALRGLDLDLVVTVGRTNDPAALGPQPANVAVHRWVPQDELLPRCDLVIAHGGAGTTLGALAHGIPLLVIPQGADQWANAERVANAGAGLRLDTGELNAEALRASVAELLRDPAYRRAAGELATQIRAMPSAAELVPVLEALAEH
jgi:hypothetical protein